MSDQETKTKKSSPQVAKSEEGLSVASCSLPEQFRGPFYGIGCGKIFQRAKYGDCCVLDIRGWGHLTGSGTLAMNEEEAAKVQDQFEKWVIDTLNRRISGNAESSHSTEEG